MTAARTTHALSLEPGLRLANKLELVRRLGEGGMGAVWTARNVTTGAEVAVKVLLPERQKAAHAVERFRHEAKLGATLAHRNITRVFDLLEAEDGSLVLVMELLRGDTLRSYLAARGRLTSEEAVAIAVPILSALQHAHDHGVVHRDLKPSNIFLHVEPDGHAIPKLLDFGIAKVEDSSIHTRTGDTLGTPSYMSPEQVRARTELDGRSDLFSIGVVLYETITGENPFRAPTSSGALAQVLEAEVDPDPRIDPRVWLEIRRALSKQPYERHGSARELASALCAAIGRNDASLAEGLRFDDLVPEAIESSHEPIVTSVPVAQSTPRPTRSRRRLFLSLAAIAATSALVTSIVLRGRTTTDEAPPRAQAATVTAITTPEPPPATAEPPPPIELDPPPPAQASAAPTTPPARPATRAVKRSPSSPTPKPTPSSTSIARKPGF